MKMTIINIDEFIKDYIGNLEVKVIQPIISCPYKKVITDFLRFALTCKSTQYINLNNDIRRIFREEECNEDGTMVHSMTSFIKDVVIKDVFITSQVLDFYILNEMLFKSVEVGEGYDKVNFELTCRGSLDEHCYHLLNILLEFAKHKKEKLDMSNLETFYIMQKLEREDENAS